MDNRNTNRRTAVEINEIKDLNGLINANSISWSFKSDQEKKSTMKIQHKINYHTDSTHSPSTGAQVPIHTTPIPMSHYTSFWLFY